MSRPRTVVAAAHWLPNNTMKVQLGTSESPLTDPDTGDVITTATVTCTVVDSNGTPVSGETWPLSMPHVGGVGPSSEPLDGVYRGYPSYNVDVDEDETCWAQITADVGGVRYYAKVEVLGVRRSGATATT